jgi:hypothetical protein
MMGSIEIDQTKSQETIMNRIKLTFAASGNKGLFDRFITWLETRYARKLEDYFAPSPQAIAFE